MDHEIFEAGDIALQSGRMLRNAKLAYKTYGKLNAKRDNAIVYPTWFASTHADNEWLIGPGKLTSIVSYRSSTFRMQRATKHGQKNVWSSQKPFIRSGRETNTRKHALRRQGSK